MGSAGAAGTPGVPPGMSPQRPKAAPTPKARLWWQTSNPLPGHPSHLATERLLDRARDAGSLEGGLGLVFADQFPGPAFLSVATTGVSASFADGPEHYVRFRWTPKESLDWEAPTLTGADGARIAAFDGQAAATVAARRLALVALPLRRGRRFPGTPASLLTRPHEVAVLTRAHTSMALAMWWHDRMTEGHTPQAARLLLGLVMDPQTYASLSWDENGAPFFPNARVAIVAPRDLGSRWATGPVAPPDGG